MTYTCMVNYSLVSDQHVINGNSVHASITRKTAKVKNETSFFCYVLRTEALKNKMATRPAVDRAEAD